MSANLNDVILPGIGFLENLTDEERDQLKLHGEAVVAEKGKTIIQEKANQDHLYVLLSGKAKVMQDHVRPAVTAWLKPGESFGEVNLFDLGEKGASASVEADEECLLWRVDRDGLNVFMEENSGASLRLVIGISTLLSKRLRAMNDLVREMSVWTRA